MFMLGSNLEFSTSCPSRDVLKSKFLEYEHKYKLGLDYVPHVKQTLIFDCCVVKCGFKKRHQRRTCLTRRPPTYFKSINYHKFN